MPQINMSNFAFQSIFMSTVSYDEYRNFELIILGMQVIIFFLQMEKKLAHCLLLTARISRTSFSF